MKTKRSKARGALLFAVALGILFMALLVPSKLRQRFMGGAQAAPAPTYYTFRYRPDGTLARIVPCRYGERHGLEQRYDRHGRLRALIRYKHGEMEGWSIYYFPDGRLQTMVPYHRGVSLIPLSLLRHCTNFEHPIFKRFYKLYV
jgi:hypothetical protein